MHEKLSINELRQRWAEAWGHKPNSRIGRVMLEQSLKYKLQTPLRSEQEEQLKKLIGEYKRNPAHFNALNGPLKPGTRLMRIYQGKKHNVLVRTDGFEYRDQIYASLSKIANDITGKRWNGWVFFGIKKAGPL